ncbi:MAG TPA: BolA family protein [Solimonas sp.]|nr:BolA family protein [Solimonas sp.]
MRRIEQMRALLEQALAPQLLEIEDDSHLHKGHAGAAGGAGHYRLRIVSARFEGLAAVARHRLVYAALAELMPAQVHALGIVAQTPLEAGSQA